MFFTLLLACHSPDLPVSSIASVEVENDLGGLSIDRFDVQPGLVAPGEPVALEWETRNASWCGLGGELGSIPSRRLGHGKLSFVPLRDQKVTLTCVDGIAIQTAEVRISLSRPALKILRFEMQPAVAYYGQAGRVSWSSLNADGCELGPDGQTVETTGEREVHVFPGEGFELLCWSQTAVTRESLLPAVLSPRLNEVAWSGTTLDANAEWIELFNPAPLWIDLAGWSIEAADGTPLIELKHWLGPGEHALLERTSDAAVPDVTAWEVYNGALVNGGESLALYDAVGRLVDLTPPADGGWVAGDETVRASMERLGDFYGADRYSWETGSMAYGGGLGTPGFPNRASAYPAGGTTMSGIEVYLADHAASGWPYAEGEAGRRLVEAVAAATQSVAVAAFGVGGFQQFSDALTAAAFRGVSVRVVADAGREGGYTFPGMERLAARLPGGAVVSDAGSPGTVHHKFVVIDGVGLWTGTSNFSGTGLAGDYNCNISVFIRHRGLAQAYLQEFEELFAGRFRNAKRSARSVRLPREKDGTRWEAYFSPGGEGTTRLVTAIDRAERDVVVYAYRLSERSIVSSLAGAAARGVTVRGLVDTGLPDFDRDLLAAAGIDFRFESASGKGHQKLVVVDGYRVIFGSQNFDASFEYEADDNLLYVENEPLASLLLHHFEADWAASVQTGMPAEGPTSPGSLTDYLDNDHDGFKDEGAPFSTHESNDAWSLYFNKRSVGDALTEPNYVNLAEKLEARIRAATESVDAAFYDLDLPDLVAALSEAASRGVRVRLILDGKRRDSLDEEHRRRYDDMRAAAEKLQLGLDGVTGTADDVAVFADAPLFAVTEPAVREAWNLPVAAAGFPWRGVTVGTQYLEGRLIVEGEGKSASEYYGAQEQMHHKFLVADNEWVWAGSWNPTNSSVTGSGPVGVYAGNTDLAVEVRSESLAALFIEEFESMWGATGPAPRPLNGRFHARKPARDPETVFVGGYEVTVAFGPATDVVSLLADITEAEAKVSARFAVFAWAQSPLSNVIQQKWETAAGERTGFVLEGVFSRLFWNAWWSASNAMRGAPVADLNGDPVVPWSNYPPVFADAEERKLHAKLMLLDAETANGVLALGSANWGENAAQNNDEALLVIRHPRLVREAMAFWKARYLMAGGTLVRD